MPDQDFTNQDSAAENIPLRIPDHELLRRVGKGSYGEVWLARNVVGTYRAVKLVWRHHFEEAKPYEREFEGMRNFEPISRAHEGLVDVLQVGRNDEKGYFYYVMELADDADTGAHVSANGSPGEDYRPKTLREAKRKSGRLPVATCVELGVQLASALHYFHRAGLVHRDIKPSNVIFVGGIPKLADIGLVTGITEAQSYVGTEGFVPPEGPGRPQADIYSLGKLLYELVTGFDRHDFPKVPAPAKDEGSTVARFAEINEILLRACDPDVKSRYGSAQELLGELLLLQSGKSVQKLRGFERRFAKTRRLSIAAGLVTVAVCLAYFGSFKQFDRARKAERRAVANVEQLQLQKAEDLFQRDDSSSALAHLAHVARSNPTNRVAVERLVAALTWRSFVLPKMDPIIPTGRPNGAVFSPDDRDLLTFTFNGFVESWNPATGKARWQRQLGDHRVFSAEYSADGRMIAFVVEEFAFIVDRETGQDVIPPIEHRHTIRQIKFSPDRSRVLVSGGSSHTRVLDASTGRPVGAILDPDGYPRVATFSPDGRRVAIGTTNGWASVWDAETSRQIGPRMAHGSRVSHVVFSPDGTQLATTTAGNEPARLWNSFTGELLAELPHKDSVTEINFSPDGGKVVTASEDGSASIWDTATGGRIGQPMVHRNWVRYAGFSPDGGRVVTASEDNTVRLWDADTGLPVSEPMRHPKQLAAAQFDKRGEILSTVVSSIPGRAIWLWNSSSEEARSLPLVHSSGVNEARFDATGDQIVGACRDGTVRVWNKSDYFGKSLVLRHDQPAQKVIFNRKRDLIGSVTGNRAWVWDVAGRQPLAGPLEHAEPIRTLQFSPDGRQLLTASEDGTAAIWDVKKGERVLILPPPSLQPSLKDLRSDDVFVAQFSPDGGRVLTTSRSGKARVWNATNASLITEFTHSHWVVHGEFSRDGKRVVTTSFDRTAAVWDAATGALVGALLTHDNDVVMARFSADGRHVVTASTDWTAQVWDVETGRPVSDPLRHDGPVRTVCFSPDGGQVATGSESGTVRLWDAMTGSALTDAFPMSSGVVDLEFSPKGDELLMVTRAGDVEVYDLFRPDLPAPHWLPDLAEAVGGQRLGENGMLQPVPPARFFELRREMRARPGSDFYDGWAKWLLADRATRRISPGSQMTYGEFIRRKIDRNTRRDLRETLWLSPRNALAHARLAEHMVEGSLAMVPRERSAAAWHSEFAVTLAPQDPEVARIRVAVLKRLGEQPPRHVSIP